MAASTRVADPSVRMRLFSSHAPGANAWLIEGILVARVTTASLSLGCTGDDAGGGRGDAPKSAAELAEHLVCDRTAPCHWKGWDQERPVECYMEEG